MADTAQTLSIVNATRNRPVAGHARVANNLSWRLRGMIGRQFDRFDALVFPRCNSIHMFFMTMPLDVLFLDRKNRVCALRESLPPWRMAASLKAVRVIELPSGAIGRSGTRPGDQLDFRN